MRVWLDVTTPKQARLMASIAKWLGCSYLITSKGLRESVELLEKLNVRFSKVGRYATGGLRDKLLAYAERVSSLLDIVLNFKPDVLISFSSPEAVRVAFGLSIKAVTMNDTPHSYHVARLTFPLSWRVVYPEAIPRGEMIRLGASEEVLTSYGGVDEVAWVKEFLKTHEQGERTFSVFIRPEESCASYLLGKDGSIALNLIKDVLEIGAEVLVKPRYPHQREAIERKYGDKVRIVEEAVDTLTLFSQLSLVITGGGTMAREAALLGTPSISTFPLNVRLHVNDYLQERGFPIWRAYKLEDAREIVRAILKDPDRFVVDTRRIVEDLEDPRVVIGRLLGGLDV
ncbi:MAG: DUF354 domain-containing protein [Candidatus Korarchaeota archaeon]|nr:DUF354 domain-containing protein [Candidatus Korarchaeota archaeon]